MHQCDDCGALLPKRAIDADDYAAGPILGSASQGAGIPWDARAFAWHVHCEVLAVRKEWATLDRLNVSSPGNYQQVMRARRHAAG
jgi:hypothetical protein